MTNLEKFDKTAALVEFKALGPVPIGAMHDPGLSEGQLPAAMAVDCGPPHPNWPRTRSAAPHDIRCSRCGGYYPMSCKCDDRFPLEEMSAKYHAEWLCIRCRCVPLLVGAPP